MTSNHTYQGREIILMPGTEPLQKKGLEIEISGALVSSDSAELKALSCHAFF